LVAEACDPQDFFWIQLLLDVLEAFYVTRLPVLDVIISSNILDSDNKSSPTSQCSHISLPALGSLKPRAPLKRLKTPTAEPLRTMPNKSWPTSLRKLGLQLSNSTLMPRQKTKLPKLARFVDLGVASIRVLMIRRLYRLASTVTRSPKLQA